MGIRSPVVPPLSPTRSSGIGFRSACHESNICPARDLSTLHTSPGKRKGAPPLCVPCKPRGCNPCSPAVPPWRDRACVVRPTSILTYRLEVAVGQPDIRLVPQGVAQGWRRATAETAPFVWPAAGRAGTGRSLVPPPGHATSSFVARGDASQPRSRPNPLFSRNLPKAVGRRVQGLITRRGYGERLIDPARRSDTATTDAGRRGPQDAAIPRAPLWAFRAAQSLEQQSKANYRSAKLRVAEQS
jgi:hypothetical protein